MRAAIYISVSAKAVRQGIGPTKKGLLERILMHGVNSNKVREIEMHEAAVLIAIPIADAIETMKREGLEVCGFEATPIHPDRDMYADTDSLLFTMFGKK